uniref:Uncharacterized protein n=1 Tax=Arundo donax TaxID=35708 RepID=A0A0A9GY56_ARUDO
MPISTSCNIPRTLGKRRRQKQYASMLNI